MQFHITRTSCTPDDQEERPCDEAEWRPYTVVSVHTHKSPEEFDARWAGQLFFGEPYPRWNEQGTNHRLHPKGIARDFPGEGWFVALDRLEDLMAFVAGHGRVVVKPAGDDGFPEIEIYDCYRE